MLEQLRRTGSVLSTVPLVTGKAVAVLDGVTAVPIRLGGRQTGTTTFDDVRLWEE